MSEFSRALVPYDPKENEQNFENGVIAELKEYCEELEENLEYRQNYL